MRIGEVRKVVTLWSMPAVSTERLELFLAAYGPEDRVSAGGGADDENECIVVHEVALAELWRRATIGELPDAKTFTLLQSLRLALPELFD